MRNFFPFALALLIALPVTPARAAEAAAPVKRLLYMSSPDGAQPEGRSGNGILVFDIDDGHRFVRRIEVPGLADGGVRGFTASARNHAVYYSTTNRRLGCFDLETEKVVWERTYPAGCDRSAITLDGARLYVPTGWWYAGADSGFLVVDARDGALLRQMPIGQQAHNSLVTLDGRHVFLGTETRLTMIDTRDDRIVLQVPDVGESGVFPFTVDRANRRAYVCLGKTVGFDVVDLAGGRVLHRVHAGESPIAHRTHGVGLTPDETELWISDQEGRKLFIFDATQSPPKPKGQVSLIAGGHGWIAFSLDGAYAWCHTPDVYNARTKERVALLKDQADQLFSSSKFVEIHFQSGKVVRVGSEFGLGRAGGL